MSIIMLKLNALYEAISSKFIKYLRNKERCITYKIITENMSYICSQITYEINTITPDAHAACCLS